MLEKAEESPADVVQTLVISPREIDLGRIAAGQEKGANFSIKGVGMASQSWSVSMTGVWFPLDKTELMGTSADNAEEKISIHLRVIKRNEVSPAATFPVQIVLENRSRQLICVRELSAGSYREAVLVETSAGQSSLIYIRFTIMEIEEPTESPVFLSVLPPRLDYGKIKRGESVTKRLLVTNKGPGAIRWKAKTVPVHHEDPKQKHVLDHYISFVNDHAVDKGVYTVPSHLGQQLQIWGTWSEENGYPVTREKSVMRLDFYGRSLSLLLKKTGDKDVRFSGQIGNTPIRSDNIPLDDDMGSQVMNVLLADNLQEGRHTLTLAFSADGVMLEGILTKRQDVTEGNRKHITISPAMGSATKSVNFVAVTVNSQAPPGIYTNQLLVASQDDEMIISLFYEVVTEQAGSIDIYRYRSGTAYLYAPGIPADELRLTSRGFVKEGLAFRLFPPGAAATLPLHKWYNPTTVSHFYSYDLAQGNKLKGYVYEGVAGNIATSKLSGTRELYRWDKPKTKRFFFALDVKGTAKTMKGYVFQGITGYVKR